MGRLTNLDYQYDLNSGKPNAGGKLFFRISGTNTPQDTFSDKALTMANPNPVILNSAGRFPFNVFLNPNLYRVIVEDSLGSQISLKDDIVEIIASGDDLTIGALTLTGKLISDDVTESVSTATGAMQTDGGLGVAKDAFIGGKLDLAGLADVGTLSVEGAIAEIVDFDSLVTGGPRQVSSAAINAPDLGFDWHVVVTPLDATNFAQMAISREATPRMFWRINLAGTFSAWVEANSGGDVVIDGAVINSSTIGLTAAAASKFTSMIATGLATVDTLSVITARNEIVNFNNLMTGGPYQVSNTAINPPDAGFNWHVDVIPLDATNFAQSAISREATPRMFWRINLAGTFSAWVESGGGDAIDGATITNSTLNSTPVGGVTPADGTFAALNSTGGGSHTGTHADMGSVTTIDINGGTADNVNLGGAVAGPAKVTTLDVSGISTLGDNIVMAIGKGIDFSATADGTGVATSELLDDYEEGTWTPVLIDSSANEAVMTIQEGSYTRVGNMVTVWCKLATSSVVGLTSDVRVGGLPYIPVGTPPGSICGAQGSQLAITAGSSLSGRVDSGGLDRFNVNSWDSASGSSGLGTSEWSPDGNVQFFGSYKA